MMTGGMLAAGHWLLCGLAIALGLALVAAGARYRDFRASWVGILVGALMVAGPVELILSGRVRRGPERIFTPPAFGGARRALRLAPARTAADPEPAPPREVWLDVARGASVALDEQLAAAAREGSWLLVHADGGVPQRHREWVERRFGPVTELREPGPREVCWRRLAAFPYASGECASRRVRFALHPGAQDLARISAQESVGALYAGDAVPVVLLTQEAGERPSPEETCLRALAAGQACVAVELPPGPAMTSLALQTTDEHLMQGLAEFGVPRLPLTEALSVYGIDNGFTSTVAPEETDAAFCGGFATESRVLHAMDLQAFANQLEAVSSETGLSNTLARLGPAWHCPGFGLIRLNRLSLKNTEAGMRSLLAQLLETAVWLTTPSDYVRRTDKLSKVELAQAPDGTLWIDPAGPLRGLGLTVVAPWAFEDRALKAVVSGSDDSGWRVFRQGASSFRLTVEHLAAPLGFELGSLLQAPAARRQLPGADTDDLFRSLLIASILAAGLSLLQTVASTGGGSRGFWPATYFPGFVIVFVVVWVSFQGTDFFQARERSVTGRELAALPSHLFLREWPEDWFPADNGVTSESSSRGRWTAAVAKARQDAREALEGADGSQLRHLGLSSVVRARKRAGGSALLWDDDGARNWYYRKSQAYPSVLVGWKALLESGRYAFTEVQGPELKRRLGRDARVVITPDAGHLAPDLLLELALWVKRGGHFLFSDMLSADESDEGGGVRTTAGTAATAGDFLQALEEAGLGASKGSYYSLALLPDGSEVELKDAHRVPQFRTVAFGEGTASFLGVMPLDTSGARVADWALQELLGQKYLVRELGGRCRTTILLEPYGLPPDKFAQFAAKLHEQGIEIQWLVDAESFAAMVPTWEREFSRRGVVFRDDGTRAARELASALWSEFNKDKVPPSFATIEHVPRGYNPGPPGVLFHAHLLPPAGSSAWREAAAGWEAECANGAAEPRLVPLGDFKENMTAWHDALVALKDLRFVTAAELAREYDDLAQTSPEDLLSGRIAAREVPVSLGFKERDSR